MIGQSSNSFINELLQTIRAATKLIRVALSFVIAVEAVPKLVIFDAFKQKETKKPIDPAASMPDKIYLKIICINDPSFIEKCVRRISTPNYLYNYHFLFKLSKNTQKKKPSRTKAGG
jgi:hypothetical protein